MRMAPLWRLAGNPQFDQSLEWIDARLTTAGIATHYDTIASASRGWEMRDAELRLDGPDGEVVLSKAQDRVPLAINSFATSAEGSGYRVVDVGKGTDATDYDGKDVAGAVVLADGPLASVWSQAVKARGAAGVISTQIAAYTRPEHTPDVLQWGNIPFDPEHESFGFKATPRAAKRLRERLAAGAAQVHVRADTVFHRRPVRTLVAEIPGTRSPDERVVLVAHVQEPGANDNASGCGTLLAAALAMRRAIADGVIPAPARTITLLWGDEIRASDAWIAADARASRPRAGHDVARHDRGGYGEDRRHVPDREGTGPECDLGAAVGPALGVGRQRSGSRARERDLPQRPAPCASPCGARATPAGWSAPIRTKAAAITPRSRGRACPRSSTGTSPTATTTPTSTPSTR